MKADTCEGCGHPISEAWSAQADPGNFEGTHVYQVPPPIRCHACTEISIQQSVTSSEGKPRPHPSALHYPAIRRNRR